MRNTPLYRIPWTVSDAVITWIEPTKECNMRCSGCFSANNPGKHKPLRSVLSEIDAIRAGIKTDVIAIAGGDPLCYPHLTEVIRHIKESGFHPFLITNGALLSPASLASFKAAGLSGVCLHIDSLQNRDGWAGKDESELNGLRQHYVDMVRREGGLSCYLNMTVTKANLPHVGDVYAWARGNAPLVELMIFITFKTPEHITGEQRAAIAGSEVKTDEIAAAITARDRNFKLCAILRSAFSGAEKWSVAAVPCGHEDKFISPQFFGAAQELSRRWRGRYLGRLRKMRPWEAALAAILLIFRRGVAFSDIRALFGGVQAVLIVQPETIVWGQKPRFFM